MASSSSSPGDKRNSAATSQNVSDGHMATTTLRVTGMT